MKEISEIHRERDIYRVTLAGSLINFVLIIGKFAAGVLGHSSAMIADAVHSLSDFFTDVIVLLFIKISNKPKDETHDYGHGKYETLATAIIGIVLLAVGLMIFYTGLTKIWTVLNGGSLSSPGWIAFAAAIVSILLKEWVYRFTIRVGHKYNSEAVVANAWHHRSDALSSIGTAIGVGGAIMLGSRWTVLDPIAAVVVSVFVVYTAYGFIRNSVEELLEKSLPRDIEDEIVKIAESEQGMSQVHNLRTRRIGSHVAIELHIRMQGSVTLFEAHAHSMNIERRLRERFGTLTHVGVHIEPLKTNGKYENPEAVGKVTVE